MFNYHYRSNFTTGLTLISDSQRYKAKVEYTFIYFHTMAVLLSDQYVLLLQNVVEKNKPLREQLQKCVQETKSCIEDMKSKADKIDNLSAGGGRRIHQTGPVKDICVPKLCRVSIYSCT